MTWSATQTPVYAVEFRKLEASFRESNMEDSFD